MHQGDTAETPYAFGTGGSRSGPVLGAAVRQTALELRAKVTELAAHRLEAAAADIEVVDGVASVRGTPSRALTFAELARSAYFDLADLPTGMEPGLELIGRYRAPDLMYSNACHVCTVEIDRVTGAVEVLRYVVSETALMINPAVVHGQIDGGAVQGIGGALLEEFVYDEAGNPLTTTFLDYLIPTAADVPSSSTATSRPRRRRPATTRASAKGARSAHRPRSRTR